MATSCATAKASWLAAQITYKYNNAWPETIRGLIVHSASWTEQMISQTGNGLRSRTDYNSTFAGKVWHQAFETSR